MGTDSLSSSPSLDVLADVAELARIARSQGYTDRDLHARLLGAATSRRGARRWGSAVGPDRTGYLAVGALADLTFFDVQAGPDAVPELVEHGAGRTATTIVSGEVRFAIDSFDRAAVTPETGGVS